MKTATDVIHCTANIAVIGGVVAALVAFAVALWNGPVPLPEPPAAAKAPAAAIAEK